MGGAIQHRDLDHILLEADPNGIAA